MRGAPKEMPSSPKIDMVTLERLFYNTIKHSRNISMKFYEVHKQAFIHGHLWWPGFALPPMQNLKKLSENLVMLVTLFSNFIRSHLRWPDFTIFIDASPKTFEENLLRLVDCVCVHRIYSQSVAVAKPHSFCLKSS